MKLPLGRKEGKHLEFERGDSLDRPATIAREVVGFLNAEGGAVWIGFEDDGHGVARRVVPIPDAERRRSALLDHLLDTIEPVPREVRVRVHSDAEHGDVLEVRVPPGRSKPYALLGREGRLFVARAGDRLRVMSRDEWLRAATSAAASPPEAATLDDAHREVRQARDQARERALKQQGGLWLWLQAAPPVSIALGDWEQHLLDPTRTGGRPDGYSVASHLTNVKRLGSDLRGDIGDVRRVHLSDRGRLSFETDLASLRARSWRDPVPGPEILPYALIGFVVSAHRLAGAVVGASRPRRARAVVADLALFGVHGWTLRPSLPGDPFRELEPVEAYAGDDVTAENALEFEAQQLAEAPDACARRLLLRVYASFGLRSDQMPLFDGRSGAFDV